MASSSSSTECRESERDCELETEKEKAKENEKEKEIDFFGPYREEAGFYSVDSLPTKEQMAAVRAEHREAFIWMYLQWVFSEERWAEGLKGHLFTSIRFVLTERKTAALLAFCQSGEGSRPEPTDLCLVGLMQRAIDQHISRLSHLLASHKSSHSSSSRSSFYFLPKLDLKSPKDGVCAFPSWLKEGGTSTTKTEMDSSLDVSHRFVAQFEENLRRARVHGKLTIPAVNRAFHEARILSLCCKTGEQALLLLRQSPKMVQDLQTRTQLGSECCAAFPAVLTLRKWEESVYHHPEWEFRCFIRQGKLTAITPVIVWLFSDDVTRNQAKIKQTICAFVETLLLPHVPFHTFVADLYLHFAGDFSLDVISLFPFDRKVHTGLFSWEQDQTTLLHGPTEFRVLSKAPAAEVSILPREWQKFVTDKYGLDFTEARGLDVYKSSRCPIS